MGVSGFSYPGWKGRFYPDSAKNEQFLSLYSQRLKSVEVNSSFYAAPGTTTLEGWSARTDDEFRFSFKAPRLITHVTKLGKGSAESALKFSKTLDLLGARRGPVLFQLPPFLKANHDLLARFLAETSDIKPRAFEFRHESWLATDTYRLLDENDAGFCIAETEDMEPIFKVTGGFAYFRLRKDSYEAKAIEQWARKILRTVGDSGECYVYLRHDETGENAVLAERLLEELLRGK